MFLVYGLDSLLFLNVLSLSTGSDSAGDMHVLVLSEHYLQHDICTMKSYGAGVVVRREQFEMVTFTSRCRNVRRQLEFLHSWTMLGLNFMICFAHADPKRQQYVVEFEAT
mmetsp:Transcript_1401/g.4167  ORF Transcript_1401/g.4167 Transcript_1401/m.4167 type:complete len:110 (+) Transcript_1401:1489-1818(+)